MSISNAAASAPNQADIEREISAWVGRSRKLDSLAKLPGDASTRQYFRAVCSGQPFIVMKMDAFRELGDKLDFLEVQRHLSEAGIDVPRILDLDPARGLMLLEDLGDVTLLRRLQDVANSDVERALYERVIDSLVKLQHEASPARKPASIEAYKLLFNREKLMWEVNHTIEHFYKLHLQRQIADEDLSLMKGCFTEICETLEKQPLVLAHRDFHSRNIMIAQADPRERFVMIDFQDARLGPAQYDLASLLRDSYYQLDEAQVSRLLDYYVARWEAASGQHLNREEFIRIFDLMSVQRNFKAIGSFASFQNKRGNATYLKYIGNTFENIRRTLLKYPKYSRLREVLFHYYYF